MCVYVDVCVCVCVCVCVYVCTQNHTRISGYVEITLCLSRTSVRTNWMCDEFLKIKRSIYFMIPYFIIFTF